jgi:3-deoxy-D-manno-octulosonic-acid transferase
MLRYFYSFCFYLALPFIALRLLIKSRRNPAYRRRWRERLGWFTAPAHTGGIWVHVVSVGETIASVPMIKQLQQQYPGKPLILTSMTPTGSERVRALFNDKVFHIYMPYDFPGAVKRFLKKVQPDMLILMETELWPNYLHYCAQQNIPVLLANARLSEKSYKSYCYIKPLVTAMMRQITHIAAQAQPDAERFIRLGADPARVTIAGSMKFDMAVPQDIQQQASALRTSLGAQRHIWIAASTHEGEEEQVLAALQKVRQYIPDVLLILVPRHPERFPKVEALCQKQGYHVVKRSQQQPCLPSTAIYLGDTMGELLLQYAVSDVAYVGGSLVPIGGHNMLEPAALGVPSITGKYYFNFTTIVQLLEAAGGLKRIQDADELAASVIAWLNDPQAARQAGERALTVVAAHRGAVAAHLQIVNRIMQ